VAVETYQHTDSEYLKIDNGKQKDAGSTASTAILVGDRLLVANVGDSKVVISRAGKGMRKRLVMTLLTFHRGPFLQERDATLFCGVF
jgi:serine/threonine protein phosphatase PrpC